MEVIVDVLLVLTAIAAIVAGWRRGAVLSVVPMVALVAGLWLGLTLAPQIVTWFARIVFGGPDAGSTVQRTVVAAVVVGLCAAVLYGVAATVSAVIRRKLRRGVARGVDAVGGAAVGLATWAIVIWLVAGFLQTTNLIQVTQVVSSSKVVAALNQLSPIPASRALGAMDDVLARAGLPKVFTGGETVRPAAPPDPSIPDAVNAQAGKVVKVLASEPQCGTVSEGSGWVVAANRVVTNAHVVAGSSAIVVRAGGGPQKTARLVAFDPQRDLAVLAVPGLGIQPLTLGTDLAAGDSAFAAGYPGNGAYVATPARIRQVLNATGTDIYRQQAVTREIYSLRGVVRPGNSGGPLFDAQGRVVGVVFARSTTDADTGYALTLAEIAPVLKPVLTHTGSSTPVDSGHCPAE